MPSFKKMYPVLFVLMLIATPIFGEDNEVAKLTFGEHKWIQLHYLLQVQGYSQNIYDSNALENETDDATWSKGLQIKRSRIILKGQAAQNVSFFMETDDFKIGEQGPASTYASSADYATENDDNVKDVKDKQGVFTQDAFINYKIADEIQIAVGMILLPFMHNSRSSAASHLGIDYNSKAIPLKNTTNVWRDTGIEARGIIGEVLDYKIGVFRGQGRDLQGTPETNDDINPHSEARYCGRIQLNFADPETGFFYSGNYLGKRNIFSVGGALDYQNHAIRDSNNKLANYMAWTGDITIDYKIKEDLVAEFQGAYVHAENIPGETAGKQTGYFAQMGLLVGSLQPVVKYVAWIKKGADTDGSDLEISYAMFGLSYFINGHNANIKMEYQNPLGDDHKAQSGEKLVIIQFQIFI